MPPKPPRVDAPVILAGGTRTNTGVMRGRDVRFALTGHAEPKVIEVVGKIAEINHANVMAITELANNFDRLLDVVQNFADIAENMKKRTDQMVRGLEGEQEGGPEDGSNHSTN